MKIICLNTWGCRKQEEIFAYLGSHIATTDIFCLQEVFTGEAGVSHRGEVKNCLELLVAMFPDFVPYFFSSRGYDDWYGEPHNGYWYGLATFVRKDHAVESVDQMYTIPEDMFRACGRAKAATGAMQVVTMKGLTVCNLHGLWQDSGKGDTKEREMQTKTILDALEGKGGQHVLCGTFNLSPETKSVTSFESRYRNLVKEYHVEKTRSGLSAEPLRYSDYVFVSPDTAVKSFSVPDIEVSDHLPLVTEFT